ncbi:hypothetical protein [Aeromonas caviae]|uniref:hypothetical protein n=1 Tax=Aeromonas caviae TaxID=648 RepID=UPI002B4AA264|nr:hypothetical protein [Aeromonas caviae]
MMPLPILSAAIMTFLVSLSATAGTLQCNTIVGTGARFTMAGEQNSFAGSGVAPSFRFREIAVCVNPAASDLRIHSGEITIVNDKETITQRINPVSTPQQGVCPDNYYRIGYTSGYTGWSYIYQTTYINSNMSLYSSNIHATDNALIRLFFYWPGGSGGGSSSPGYRPQRPTHSVSRTITFDESQTIALDAGTTVSYPISGKISSDSGMPLADVFYKIRPAEADGLHVKFNNGENDITTRWTFPTLLVTADRNTGTGSYRRVIDATVTCP